MPKAQELYFFEPLLCFPIHLLFPPSQLLLSYPEVFFSTPSLLLWVLPIHLHWEVICALDFRVSTLGVIGGDGWSICEWCLINQVPFHFVQSICLYWLLFSSHVFTFGLIPILFPACITKETLRQDQYLQLYLQEGYCSAWFIGFHSFLLTHTQRVPLELYLQICLYCFLHLDDPM
jgi:hypothetical protein